MAVRPIFPDTIRNEVLEMDNADGTTTLSLIAGGTNGTRVDRISVTSDDTADVTLDVFHYNGASDFLLGSVTIPAGAGTDGGTTPSVSLLTQTNFPFLGDDLALHVENGDSLRVAAQSAITSAKVVHLVVYAGDY